MDYLKDILDFLAANPGASVLMALAIFWRIGKDVLLPIVKGNNATSDKQLGISESLTTVITSQQNATNIKLGNIETSNEKIVEQNAKTLEFYEKMSFAFDQQHAQHEKYLDTVSKGFTEVLKQHEELTSKRYDGVETFIVQNTAEMLAMRQQIFDVKMSINYLAERIQLLLPPLTGDATEPLSPIRKTQPLVTVVVEDEPE